MDPLPIIALVATGTLYGLAWHNQPARIESSIKGDDAIPSKAGRTDWAVLSLWGFVIVCFAAFFFGIYLVSKKCCAH